MQVIDLYKDGMPYDYLINFWRLLEQNPSFHSRQELFNILLRNHHPIHPDGCFMAWKAIREDWMDKHSGTVDNHVGQKPFQARKDTDDDYRKECSNGLHVGSIDYVKSFANNETDRIVEVKVNPKDVVSVPEDSGYQKVRVETYEVIREVNKADLFPSNYQSYVPRETDCFENDEEEDYEDEDDSYYGDSDSCDESDSDDDSVW